MNKKKVIVKFICVVCNEKNTKTLSSYEKTGDTCAICKRKEGFKNYLNRNKTNRIEVKENFAIIYANNNNMEIFVDIADLPIVRHLSWWAGKYNSNRSYYAFAKEKEEESGLLRKYLMHNYITKEIGWDHIDRNGLNNRRENLRKASRSENAANKEKPVTNSSGFKGVSWNKRNKKWSASIKKDQKQIWLGSYSSKEDAALAYNKAATELFGEYACLNDI